MNIYHVRIDFEDDWYGLEVVEDERIHTQARTPDEAVIMIRDVIDLLKGEKQAELRLIVPPDLPVDDTRQSGRITHPLLDDADEEATQLPSPPNEAQRAVE